MSANRKTHWNIKNYKDAKRVGTCAHVDRVCSDPILHFNPPKSTITMEEPREEPREVALRAQHTMTESLYSRMIASVIAGYAPPRPAGVAKFAVGDRVRIVSVAGTPLSSEELADFNRWGYRRVVFALVIQGRQSYRVVGLPYLFVESDFELYVDSLDHPAPMPIKPRRRLQDL